MRRARVKVAPNLGPKPGARPAIAAGSKPPATSPSNTVKESLRLGIQQRTQKDQPADDVPSSPQVAKPLATDVPETITECETESLISSSTTSATKDIVVDTVTSQAVDSVIPAPVLNQTKSTQDTGPVDDAKASVSSVTPAQPTKSSDEHKPLDPPKSVPRRSRFQKAKPNLDAPKSRTRPLSTSDAESTENETGSSAVKKPVSVSASTQLVPSKPDERSEVLQEKAVTEDEPDNEQTSDEEKTAEVTRRRKRTMREILEGPDARRPRRKTEILKEPVDRSKMTIKDLIYMNPLSNPMKTPAEKAEQQKAETAANATAAPGEAPNDAENANDCDIVEDEEDRDMPAPQVTIGPDGQIILNEKSLLIANPKNKENIEDMELVHESESNNKYGYGKSYRPKTWTLNETKKFYLALSTVGTDFTLMSKVFPSRSRTELKRKFKREENVNKDLIDKAVTERVRFDQDFMDELIALDEADTAARERKKGRRRRRRRVDVPDSEGEADPDGEPTEPRKPRRGRKKKNATNDAEKTDNVDEAKTTEKAEQKEGLKRRIKGKLGRRLKKRKELTYPETDDNDSDLDIFEQCEVPEIESEVELSLAAELHQSLFENEAGTAEDEPFIPRPPVDEQDQDEAFIPGNNTPPDRIPKTPLSPRGTDSEAHSDKISKPKKSAPKPRAKLKTAGSASKEAEEKAEKTPVFAVSQRGRKRKVVEYAEVEEPEVIDLSDSDSPDEEVKGKKSRSRILSSDDEDDSRGHLVTGDVVVIDDNTQDTAKDPENIADEHDANLQYKATPVPVPLETDSHVEATQAEVPVTEGSQVPTVDMSNSQISVVETDNTQVSAVEVDSSQQSQMSFMEVDSQSVHTQHEVEQGINETSSKNDVQSSDNAAKTVQDEIVEIPESQDKTPSKPITDSRAQNVDQNDSRAQNVDQNDSQVENLQQGTAGLCDSMIELTENDDCDSEANMTAAVDLTQDEVMEELVEIVPRMRRPSDTSFGSSQGSQTPKPDVKNSPYNTPSPVPSFKCPATPLSSKWTKNSNKSSVVENPGNTTSQSPKKYFPEKCKSPKASSQIKDGKEDSVATCSVDQGAVADEDILEASPGSSAMESDAGADQDSPVPELLEPGSLVFVPSNPTVNENGEMVPGQIHVFLVSDTGRANISLGSITQEENQSLSPETLTSRLMADGGNNSDPSNMDL